MRRNTLRDRVRRWGWTPRHEPVATEGPPPIPFIAPPPPLVPALTPIGVAAPPIMPAGVTAPFEPAAAPPEIAAALPAPPVAPGEAAPPDPAEIVPRLQGAVARVLPAIEATVAKLAAGPMPPREMERAARTLTALIRTLRELNELLGQQQVLPAGAHLCNCDMPEDIDAFRNELARRINAFVDSRAGEQPGARPPEGYVPYGA